MTTKWNKYSYLNTDNDCLIEVTHLEGTEERILHTPLNEPPYVLLSVVDATITPNYERKQMGILDNLESSIDSNNYDANTLVTYKSIDNNGNVTYPTLKVNELEIHLDSYRRLQDQLAISNGQISKILDNLSADGWYNPNYEKSEVLNDLCEILGHEPKQTVRITGTILFEVDYDIPLDEVEDFDAHYFLQDNLSLDAYNGDVIVESWTVEDSDVNW
jgi:hypothetical protein